MLYYWLRMYVRVMPVVAAICAVGATYLAVTGDSSRAKDWAAGALGSVVGFVVGWIAMRAIEDRRIDRHLESSD